MTEDSLFEKQLIHVWPYELKMWECAMLQSKTVPRLLAQELKGNCRCVMSNLIQCAEIEENLLKILQGHETWVCSSDPDTEQQSSHGKSSD
jgi:hypothetical protein